MEAMTYSEVFGVGVRARARVRATVRVRVSGSDDLLGVGGVGMTIGVIGGSRLSLRESVASM